MPRFGKIVQHVEAHAEAHVSKNRLPIYVLEKSSANVECHDLAKCS